MGQYLAKVQNKDLNIKYETWSLDLPCKMHAKMAGILFVLYLDTT